MERAQRIRVDAAGNILRCDDGPESLTYEDEPGIETVGITQEEFDLVREKPDDFKFDKARKTVTRK